MLGEISAVMTTLNDVTKKKQAEQSAGQKAAVEVVRLAQEHGLSLDLVFAVYPISEQLGRG